MRKQGIFSRGLKLQVEVAVPTLIKVNSYTRVHFGKREKIRSYYRRAWGKSVVYLRIDTH